MFSSMLRAICLSSLLAFGCLAWACTSRIEETESQTMRPWIAPQTETCTSELQSVEFENVSFTYDPCAFGEVKTEKIPAQSLQYATDKPDNVAPEHLHFEFESG